MLLDKLAVGHGNLLLTDKNSFVNRLLDAALNNFYRI